jgi:hypothetical protein
VGSSCKGQTIPPTPVCCPLADRARTRSCRPTDELGLFIFECLLQRRSRNGPGADRNARPPMAPCVPAP